MANITGRLTLNEKQLIEVDAAPGAGGGTSADVGSLAIFSNGSVGVAYVKTGAADTAWDIVSTSAVSGTVATGAANRLALYPLSSNTVDDQIPSGGFNTQVSVAAQTLVADRTYTIPDVGADSSFIMSTGSQTIGGAKTFSLGIDNGGAVLSSVGTPVAGTDAANKNYVDQLSQGISWKTPAKVATTANITLSGVQTIDGVLLIAADRVLVKNQSTASQNGIYVVAAGAWSRSSDADTAEELLNAAVFIQEGTTLADTAWVGTANAPIVVGTSALPFVQFAGAGSYTAGNGLSLTGTQFAVALATNPGLTFSSSLLTVLLNAGTLELTATGLRVANGGIQDAQVAVAAAIARTKIASGTADHVIINNGSGVLSSEAQLSLTRGGTNSSLTAVAGGNVYSTASGLAISAAGTAGQPVLSGGTGATTYFASTGVVKAASGVLSTSNVALASEVTGTLPVANGGTGSAAALSNGRLMISSGGNIVEHSAQVVGAVYFGAPTTGLPVQDSTNFFWDDTNNRLGIGNAAPARSLDVSGASILRGNTRLEAVAGVSEEKFQATANTTDATVTTLTTFTLPTDSTTMLEASIVARRTGGIAGTAGDGATYVRVARFKNVAGTCTIFNLQSSFTSEDVAGYNATLDVTGTTARIRVTGVANTNIKWDVTLKANVNV